MDRFSNYIHRINLGDKRNLIASICSGILVIHSFLKNIDNNFNFFLKFAIGWWIAIDAAFAYPSNEQLLKSSHTCGALATLALIMYFFYNNLKNKNLIFKLLILGLIQ